MMMVVGLVQLIAYQYTRGAVMAALERGARAASVVGAGPFECEGVVADSLGEVLGGQVGASLSYGCAVDDISVRAWADGEVPGWVGGSPSLSFQLQAVARREPEP